MNLNKGALLMFDLTNRQSFENILSFYKLVKDYISESGDSVIFILVGNKVDLI